MIPHRGTFLGTVLCIVRILVHLIHKAIPGVAGEIETAGIGATWLWTQVSGICVHNPGHLTSKPGTLGDTREGLPEHTLQAQPLPPPTSLGRDQVSLLPTPQAPRLGECLLNQQESDWVAMAPFLERSRPGTAQTLLHRLSFSLSNVPVRGSRIMSSSHRCRNGHKRTRSQLRAALLLRIHTLPFCLYADQRGEGQRGKGERTLSWGCRLCHAICGGKETSNPCRDSLTAAMSPPHIREDRVQGFDDLTPLTA